ncbi:MAG: DNA polymerase III subunit alpha [Kiritimatiellaeota bacterium]|nr:DNA polymerase III subunit alpha [Kiritimatiellota bacterium]
MTEFVHLHLHSHYSLLDGACPPAELAKLAKQYGMPAVAITDHGFMGGAIDFYQTMNKAGLKPIVGCEMYVSPTTRFDKDQLNKNIRGFHLVLLTKNLTGYKNLCKLMSVAHLEGFYYKARIDRELLEQYSDGLIGLSACLKGKIPDAILRENSKDAKNALDDYLKIFGRGNFYLELMDHGIPEQRVINKGLISLAKEFEVPLVATNDVHYMKKEHSRSHELMLCIQTHSTINDEKRLKFSSDQFYFKSGDEMAQLFKEVPEAISNTLEVAEKCNLEIEFGVNHYPVYDIQTDTMTRKEYLRNICLDAIPERYGFDPRASGAPADERRKIVLERMDYELNVIDTAKYCSYFLVVWDFLRYAREQGIPVGPGRGSGAGSIVAFLTRITDIEPLEYDLLFERFLNPERVSPPDFDIDLCERRRGEVIDYVRGKYGADSVAQIGTYGTLKTKAVIKDVARAMGRQASDGDKITKLIPDAIPNVKKVTLQAVREHVKDISQMINEEHWVKEVFEYAEPLENLNRNMSIHAAGVIIGDQRLDNLVPLAKMGGGEVVTQYPAGPCEELGLLKMDFLGLRTLTVIQDATDNIRKVRGVSLDISSIPLDDKNAYSLLNKGDTVAVFQLESPGMRDLCRRFGVDRIQDVIALIALYRPGPMKFIDEFISRKTGHTQVEYDHPDMETILKETQGIMLYQEQIMQVVQKIAGFSLGQSDILRRAIGKKKTEVMKEQRDKFIAGCAENSVGLNVAEKIWEKILLFADYGFNKSHSAAYAFLAYRTAYLKANYPVEFMAAVLSSDLDKAEKVASAISECREMGINVAGPDVNVSEINFTVDGDSIRFGLAAIKGVGDGAASSIMEAREKDGEFTSLLDFCERVGSAVNARVLESLCRTGAFDRFGMKRSQLVDVLDQAVSLAQTLTRDKAAGQGSLFDLLDDDDKQGCDTLDFPDIPEFHEKEMLEDEKALLGFYISGHPLGEHAKTIETYATHALSQIAELSHDTGVRVGGLITSIQRRQSQSGNDFARLQIEDVNGTIECMLFNKVYAACKDTLEVGKPYLFLALVDAKDENSPPQLIAQEVIPMNQVKKRFTMEIHIRFHEGSAKPEILAAVKNACQAFPGETTLILALTCSNGEIIFVEAARKLKVRVDEQLERVLADIIGENKLHYKANLTVPKQKQRHWENRTRPFE